MRVPGLARVQAALFGMGREVREVVGIKVARVLVVGGAAFLMHRLVRPSREIKDSRHGGSCTCSGERVGALGRSPPSSWATSEDAHEHLNEEKRLSRRGR